MNPGSIFPGVIGAFFAILAMYSLNILPFSMVGLLLIFLGIAFMLSEIFISGFGILGLVGIVSFSLGSFLLFDEKTLGQGISYPLIIAFCLVSVSFFIFLMGYLLKIRKQSPVVGSNTLIGLKAKVIALNNKEYKVFCNGEMWNAKSKEELFLNDEIEVINIKNLILDIRRIK
jgi:membrane-bound serine protease (ClpP class)